jgi:succinoglycan biosynthesis protein ExoM
MSVALVDFPEDDGRPPLQFPMQHVAICICTRGRPKMLRRCLDSIASQVVEKWLYVQVIVASNGEGKNANWDACKFFKRFPLTFLHDDHASIARARNRAMLHARSMDAGWIAFIDDDEVADPTWLAKLMAPQLLSVPILAGDRVLLNPVPAPFWCPPYKRPEPRGLRARTTASTANIRFTSELVDRGLRFDERLGLTGGEDTDFFSRAYAAGFSIYRTDEAVTFEYMHAERVTFRGQAYRAYWVAAANAGRQARTRGRTAALARVALPAALSVAEGLLHMALAVPAAVLGPRRFKQLTLRGAKRIARGVGKVAGALGKQPLPYLVVHGA